MYNHFNLDNKNENAFIDDESTHLIYQSKLI